MTAEVCLVDSDVLSALSRGHPAVTKHARRYLESHGRLTISAVTVFERLRGYKDAIRRGRSLQRQLEQFRMLAASCIVLPVDGAVADAASQLWAHSTPRRRKALGDILIAATASANGLPLASRNSRDFQPMTKVPEIHLELVDWFDRS